MTRAQRCKNWFHARFHPHVAARVKVAKTEWLNEFSSYDGLWERISDMEVAELDNCGIHDDSTPFMKAMYAVQNDQEWETFKQWATPMMHTAGTVMFLERKGLRDHLKKVFNFDCSMILPTYTMIGSCTGETHHQAMDFRGYKKEQQWQQWKEWVTPQLENIDEEIAKYKKIHTQAAQEGILSLSDAVNLVAGDDVWKLKQKFTKAHAHTMHLMKYKSCELTEFGKVWNGIKTLKQWEEFQRWGVPLVQVAGLYIHHQSHGHFDEAHQVPVKFFARTHPAFYKECIKAKSKYVNFNADVKNSNGPYIRALNVFRNTRNRTEWKKCVSTNGLAGQFQMMDYIMKEKGFEALLTFEQASKYNCTRMDGEKKATATRRRLAAGVMTRMLNDINSQF